MGILLGQHAGFLVKFVRCFGCCAQSGTATASASGCGSADLGRSARRKTITKTMPGRRVFSGLNNFLNVAERENK